MPDDDRTRRRLGDETKGRIADLASGWSVEDDATPEPPRPDLPPRKKQKTLPPPPPGSEARKALEEAIVESKDTPKPTPRTKPPTAPPPTRSNPNAPPLLPLAATRPAPIAVATPASAKPPNAIKSGPTPTGTVDVSGVISDGLTPPVRMPPSSVPNARPATPAIEKGPIVAAKSGAPIDVPASGGKTVPPPRSVPPPKGGLKVGSASGAATAIPPTTPKLGSASGAVSAIAPTDRASGSVAALPGAAKASSSGIALPLPSPDKTDVSAPPSAVPPPLPPPRMARAAVVTDDHETSATDVDPGAHLTVPVGEFDHGPTLLAKEKHRLAYEQSTMKRDPANALLGIAEQPQTLVKETPAEVLLTESAVHGRSDPASIDPSTGRFERGDPTLGPDAMPVPLPTTSPEARLRAGAALRRKRGTFGDVKYVVTALLGVRHARRELAALEEKQTTRQQSRRRHLITLGRTAVTDGFDHPALNRAREQLATVEDERSLYTGQVAAADQELTRVRRDREAKDKQNAAEIVAIDVELAEIAKKLEPIDKEIAAVSRRAADLREALQRVDAKIVAVEASKVNVKGPRLDPAAIKAELATLRADRQAVQRDEPVIASELDALNPRIAAFEARRTEQRKRRTEIEVAEKEDQRRTEELLAAIGAKRVVVDRAAGDAETMRDKILFELGEQIYVERPNNMFAQLSPIDTIDMELGTTDRRLMELKEILSSIDKAKLARGLAVAVLLVGALGTLVVWSLSVLL